MQIIGEQDLEYLIGEWPQNFFWHIDEIASLIKQAHIDGKLGIKLYHYKRKYTVNDIIIVSVKLSNGKAQSELVEIYKIDKGDKREYLRTKSLGTKRNKGKTYISNYFGDDTFTRKFITPEDYINKNNDEILPEILLKLNKDKRFDSIGDFWIFLSKIGTNEKNKFKQILFSFLEKKKGFSTKDFIQLLKSKIKIINEDEYLFCNYLLGKEKYLTPNKPLGNLDIQWIPVQIKSVEIYYSHLDINNKSIIIKSDIENFLMSNGFITHANLELNSNQRIDITNNLITKRIINEDLYQFIKRNLNNNKIVMLFINSTKDIIEIKLLDINKIFSITIKEDWLKLGIIQLTQRITKHFIPNQQIEVASDEYDSFLVHWNEERNQLIGFKDWYNKKNIFVDDKIYLEINSLSPVKFRIWSDFSRDRDAIIKIIPVDADWEKYDIETCIYTVLSDKEKFHYRQLCTMIMKHRKVTINSIVTTLYNNPSLFKHLGDGFWGLGKSDRIELTRASTANNSFELNSYVWKYIVEIEQRDLCFELLERIRKPLTFDEICKKILEIYPYENVTINDLRNTGFINAQDERFKRYKQTGEFGLVKWDWFELISKENQLLKDFINIAEKINCLLK